MQRLSCALIAHVTGQGREIEVVPRGVALEDRYALDAQNLILGRNGDSRAVEGHPCRFQRFIADKLANPGFNAIKAVKDLHGTLYASRFPASNRLKFSQHFRTWRLG